MNKKISSIVLNLACIAFLGSCSSTKKTNAPSDIFQTPSGVEIQIIQHGKGKRAENGNIVRLHYTGKLTNGTIFDSSIQRDKPIQITLGKGQIIKGWEEALPYLHEGDKAILSVPPELAYGNQDLGIIPPNSTLIFEIDLLEVVQSTPPEPFVTAGLDTLVLDSGLKIIIVKKGNGPKVSFGRQVVAHYTGYLPNGKVFDSSYLHGQPITFHPGSGQVIKGWDEAFPLLPKGTKARLIIPPYLAYGDHDTGPIPAGSTLVFDVEVVDIK